MYWKNTYGKKRRLNPDTAYDEKVDRIIGSKDFNECKHKDASSNCLEQEKKSEILTRCWHIKNCPVGYERRNPMTKQRSDDVIFTLL